MAAQRVSDSTAGNRTGAEKQKVYAYYSKKQAELTGVQLYAKPDGGSEVVTSVARTAERAKASCNFDDAEYRGEVTHFIRTVMPPSRDFPYLRNV